LAASCTSASPHATSSSASTSTMLSESVPGSVGSSTVLSSSSSASAVSTSDSRQVEDPAVEKQVAAILKFEHGCHNLESDRGNHMSKRIGFTCLGVTPSFGFEERKSFANCASCETAPVMFVRCCHDLDRTQFSANVNRLYRTKLLPMANCDSIPTPAAFVCRDIAINSGTLRASSLVKDLGPCDAACDAKTYCHKLNDKHKEFYRGVVGADPEQIPFLTTWMKRYNYRNRVCQLGNLPDSAARSTLPAVGAGSNSTDPSSLGPSPPISPPSTPPQALSTDTQSKPAVTVSNQKITV